MKNKNTLFGIIAIIAIIFTLAACTGDGKLSGTYVNNDSNADEFKYFTFSGNKFHTVEDADDEEYGKIEGTYEIKDGVIYFTFDDMGSPDYFESEYSLKGKTLTLNDFGVYTKK